MFKYIYTYIFVWYKVQSEIFAGHMERVIPQGINYADIKPESIHSDIKLVKFNPMTAVANARPNDVIRFHLQGNGGQGFLDPYSTYLKFTVDVTDTLDSMDDHLIAFPLGSAQSAMAIE